MPISSRYPTSTDCHRGFLSSRALLLAAGAARSVRNPIRARNYSHGAPGAAAERAGFMWWRGRSTLAGGCVRRVIRAGLARLAEEQAALRRIATLVARGVP